MYQSTLGRNSINGFADTGFNFEHMYRNQPSGYTPFGKFVDRILLNLPAVQATRNRKDNIKNILKEEVRKYNPENKTLHILDLACGAARYLVELEAELREGFKALCLDADEQSLSLGKKLAQEYKATNLIEYRIADIFNEKVLDSTAFKADFIVVSGLFVYHDDDAVKKHVKLFSKYLDAGKKILVDNQINNPSRKLMEKVCTTTQGISWSLYYRTESHMQSLLSPFFTDIESSTDKWGQYNILVGRKL